MIDVVYTRPPLSGGKFQVRLTPIPQPSTTGSGCFPFSVSRFPFLQTANRKQQTINCGLAASPNRKQKTVNRQPPAAARRGFTLIELLAVLFIVGLVSAIAAPAFNEIINTQARRGAISVVLNACDFARVAALENSTPAYVGFANDLDRFSREQLSYRALIVFRKRTESDSPPASESGASEFISLSGWQQLPRPFSFSAGIPQSILHSSRAYPLTLNDSSLAYLNSGNQVPVIEFTPYGAINQPEPPAQGPLFLMLYKGQYAGGRDNFSDPDDTFFERISFSRFTGRAFYDIAKQN